MFKIHTMSLLFDNRLLASGALTIITTVYVTVMGVGMLYANFGGLEALLDAITKNFKLHCGVLVKR